MVKKTGTGGNNTLTGGSTADLLIGLAGDDRLKGLAGNDTLRGGTGDDTLEGGDGTDTADYVDALRGVTVNLSFERQVTGGAGIDRLFSIENVTGSRYDDTLRGDGDDNVLRGGDGDDALYGNGGRDRLIGGDGDDTLDVGSGKGELMLGGAGDDRFMLGTGSGSARIEDSQGDHDVIDASRSSSAADIDLTSGESSTAGGQSITTSAGGSSSLPVDLVFVQDLSGSFGDDITTVRDLSPKIVATVKKVNPDSAFGVVGFVDKPVSPFGSSTDYVYKLFEKVSTNGSVVKDAYGRMTISSGNDTPEAQIEALFQVAKRADTSVGFREETLRVAVLFTDAEYHEAGDGAAAGITRPNDGDDKLDGGGLGEDYPSVDQLRAALTKAGIVPVFAVTSDVRASYEALVDQLGFGSVVNITDTSSNVVSAIAKAAILATRTVVEDAIGSRFDDTIRGSDVANDLDGGGGDDRLYGLAGADVLSGGAGDDRIDGGSSSDTADYSGATRGVTVDLGLTVRQATGWGNDLLVSIENLVGTRFDDHLIGNTAGNRLDGGAGADTLEGGTGNDTLIGGTGDDRLEGGGGYDSASYETASAAVTVDLSETGAQNTGAGRDTLVSIEGAIGSRFGDRLLGSEDDDILSGGAGNDYLDGRNGADTLDGGDGRDRLIGGLGDDGMTGGDDDDVFVVGRGYDTVDGGAGSDIIDFSDAQTALSTTFYSGSGSIYVSYLNSTAYSNVEGLRGSTFSDTLYGSYTAEILRGGDGDDTITGYGGADTLSGERGDDTFAFRYTSDSGVGAANRDLILDFGFGADKIDLSSIDADSSGYPDDAFRLVSKFTGDEGQLIVVKSGDLRLVRGDVNGDGKADFEIAVKTYDGGGLSAGDFIL